MDVLRGDAYDRDREGAWDREWQADDKYKPDTVFVFDWDDTILPTSWLERVHALTGDGTLRPKVEKQIAGLCTIATQTLSLAGTMGAVMIITNSAPGWVAQSCQFFMPQLVQQVRGYQIVAKPNHESINFKVGAFQRECKPFRNLVSVGDGESERAASLRLQGPAAEPNTMRRTGGFTYEDRGDSASRSIKSVKLIELPTCQQLIAQHEMLQARLPDVAAFQGSLDLKARFPANGLSPIANAKGGGCTLVHFASLRNLQPAAMRTSASTGQLPQLSRAEAALHRASRSGGDKAITGANAVVPTAGNVAGGANAPAAGGVAESTNESPPPGNSTSAPAPLLAEAVPRKEDGLFTTAREYRAASRGGNVAAVMADAPFARTQTASGTGGHWRLQGGGRSGHHGRERKKSSSRPGTSIQK